MCKCGKLAIKCPEASKALQFMVDNAKQEVFDDIEKDRRLCITSQEMWNELKKKHIKG